MHSIFEQDGLIYLILDFHEGTTLKELMSSKYSVINYLKEDTALTILAQILLALDYMQKKD